MPVKYIHPDTYIREKKEFIEPVASDYFIWWLFQGRCAVCGKPAFAILDTVPNSDWTTRSALCEKHFYDADLVDLQETRKEFLLSIGRKQYVNFISAEIQVFSSERFIDGELAKGINMMMPDALDFIMVDSV